MTSSGLSRQLGLRSLTLAVVFAELGSLVSSSGGLAHIPLLSHGRTAGFIGGWSAWIASLAHRGDRGLVGPLDRWTHGREAGHPPKPRPNPARHGHLGDQRCGSSALRGASLIVLVPAGLFTLADRQQLRQGLWWFLYLGGIVAITTLPLGLEAQLAALAVWALVVFPIATGSRLAQTHPDAQVEPDQLQPDQLQPIVEMR